MADKISFAELAYEIAAKINGDQSCIGAPWPHKLHTFLMAPGVKIVVEENDGQVLTNIADTVVAEYLVRWLKTLDCVDWFMTLDNAKKVVAIWKAINTPIDKKNIAFVRSLSEPGYTWRRLPWELDTAGAAPTWDTLYSRVSNASASKAWFGSLLFEGTNHHNYHWIFGAGGDGKGAINRFWEAVMGPSYRSVQPPSPNDKFWSLCLIGGRLVTFSDCNNRSFVSSGFFKSLTGGDSQPFEFKYGAQFMAKPDSRFLFLSNERPRISGERADMRRVIYSEIDSGSVYDQGFEDKLWAEGAVWVAQCMAEYQRLCPTHGPIATDSTLIDDIVAANEEEFDIFFNKCFCLPDSNYSKRKDFAGLSLAAAKTQCVTREDFHNIVVDQWPHNKQAREGFKDFCRRKYGLDQASVRLSEGPRHLNIGIKLKQAPLPGVLTLAPKLVPESNPQAYPQAGLLAVHATCDTDRPRGDDLTLCNNARGMEAADKAFDEMLDSEYGKRD